MQSALATATSQRNHFTFSFDVSLFIPRTLMIIRCGSGPPCSVSTCFTLSIHVLKKLLDEIGRSTTSLYIL